MNRLNYSVVVFNHDDETTSECKYPTERAARSKYYKAVASAACANVGRIKLYERVEVSRGFGLRPYKFNVLNEWYDNDRDKEPEIQVAGYIVQSIRTLDKRQRVSPLGGEFFDNYADAVEFAESYAKRWNVKNPGLLVFKAIVHVHKEEYIMPVRPGTRIFIDNVE